MSDPDDRRDVPPKRREPVNQIEITAEQARVYKDCMYGLIYKAGIPYASIAHILSLWRAKPEAQQQQPPSPQALPVKRAFFFCANVMIGTFLFAPFCYRALLEKYNLDNKKKEEFPVAPVTERTPSTRLHDDYSYPIDLSSNLSNEAETTFTSELSPSRILANEDEVTKITPSTTYQDLRNKHRSSYGRRQDPPPPPPEDIKRSPYGTSDENPMESEPSFSKREPRKFVKRNKYGDEIE